MNWNPFKTRKPAADDMAVVQADTQPEPRTTEILDNVALTFKNQAMLWKRVALNTENALFTALTERDDARAEAEAALARAEAHEATLRTIAALETPGSAPAAKRMARVAREGLPEYAAGEREAA